MGREILLLSSPILIFVGVNLFVKAKPTDAPLKAVLINRMVYNGPSTDFFRFIVTLKWHRSWLDRRIAVPFKARSWLLDGDGKVVATQNSKGFSSEKTKAHWVFNPTLEAVRRSNTSWKEPLTFQGVITIDNSTPMKVNFKIPAGNNRPEFPRPSKLPFAQ